MTIQTICAVCEASDWAALPTPGKHSMTTAGKVVKDKLGKAVCNHCGMVQKVFAPRLADTDFYENHYTYYDRVGAPVFDLVRYRALAEWVAASIAPRKPERIFDVGCGHGGTLRFLRELFPQATLGGLEPSADAVKTARSEGLEVLEGRLDSKVQGTFDLVFSNNVLQHVTDPAGFLVTQKAMLAPGGDLVLSCPDGTLPNVELLMADQNFSFRPPHLAFIAAKAGLRVERVLPCPGGPLRNEQLVVLRPQTPVEMPTLPVAEPAYRQSLEAYLEQWARLDDFLCTAAADAKRVFNLGGGLWSYVLAAYCPRYWARVEACVVDGFAGQCIDKKVIPFEDAGVKPDDIIVLGTNPYVQEKLVARFTQAGLKAVAINHLIPH